MAALYWKCLFRGRSCGEGDLHDDSSGRVVGNVRDVAGYEHDRHFLVHLHVFPVLFSRIRHLCCLRKLKNGLIGRF